MRDDQSVAQQLLFSAKVAGLQVVRWLQDRKAPPRRWPQVHSFAAGESTEIRSSLYSDQRPEERMYEAGKVANLRAAARYLDGLTIPAGEVFSFWKCMGRATRRRGFVNGRMLQGGCVVPAVGGGLCQLSNVLYQLALQTGCEIVERHPHSRRLAATPVNDATVAWNYVDLRFRPKHETRIQLRLSGSELIASFHGEGSSGRVVKPSLPVLRSSLPLAATCATCAEIGCARREQPALHDGGSAFLVDAFTPEFDQYVQQTRTAADFLLVPIAGERWRLPRYAWTPNGFQQRKAQPLRTLVRAARSRRLASQGAARQTYLLGSSAAMAEAMMRDLPYWVHHVVVDQTLLVALWQAGALGGRTFDVLMRRLPISQLQARLDQVTRRWPQSVTANDFRAPADVLRAEQEALAAARRLITPHAEIAGLFAERAVLLDWVPPAEGKFSLQADGLRPRILFPGPVAARKGAYVLRDALEGLPVELVQGGAGLEGQGFWPTELLGGSSATASFSVVVQPSFVEEQPRALLHALKSGVPAIATRACGLPEQDGLEFVCAGDADALRAAVLRAIQKVGGG